jgi:hypothetical protein
MLGALGGIIILLSSFSLNYEFTFGGLVWFMVGVLLCIPNLIHLVVVDRFYGNKRK